MDDTEDYQEVHLIARLPKGTHMPSFRDDGDHLIGHAHSDADNTLVSMVRLRTDDRETQDEDEEEERELSAAQVAVLTAAATVILTGAVIYAYPRVKRWVTGTVAPAWRARFTRSDQAEAVEAVVSQEVSVEVDDQEQVTLTPQEAAQHLLSLFIAAAQAAAEYRLLSNARIVDPEQHAKLEAALRTLTAEDVIARANALLEAGTDEDVMSDITRLFASESRDSVRLSAEAVAEALRLDL